MNYEYACQFARLLYIVLLIKLVYLDVIHGTNSEAFQKSFLDYSIHQNHSEHACMHGAVAPAGFIFGGGKSFESRRHEPTRGVREYASLRAASRLLESAHRERKACAVTWISP